MNAGARVINAQKIAFDWFDVAGNLLSVVHSAEVDASKLAKLAKKKAGKK